MVEPPTTRIESGPERDGPRVPVLFDVEGGGRFIQLRPGTNLVGRGSSAFVRVDRSGVSRRHASIEVKDGHYTVRDLGSTNGTFVDGARVESATALRDGAVIRFGLTAELRFTLARPPEQGTSPLEELTKRELEVAQLAARGLSNEEAAAELGISRRTVSTHLSRIYPRLGVRGRTELAAYLRRWGVAE